MNKSSLYWTTKDGVVMNVDDMDDNHVRNAFKMLLRNIQSANTKRPIGNIESNFIEDAIKEIEDDWIEEYNNGL